VVWCHGKRFATVQEVLECFSKRLRKELPDAKQVPASKRKLRLAVDECMPCGSCYNYHASQPVYLSR
jgi:hypothetical protein